jgi:heme-degrading monooxygenase HmoA
MEEVMLTLIIDFPSIKEGKEGEFREWFTWSNAAFTSFSGFIRRRLLRPTSGGNYAIIIEYENHEAFRNVQSSHFHGEAYKRVKPLLDGDPVPRFYEVLEA